MQRQMTIGSKVAFTTGGLVATMVLLGGISIYNLAGLNKITQTIITDPLPGTARMAMAQNEIANIRGDVWRHIAEADAASKTAMEQSIEKEEESAGRALREYEATITTPEDRALFDRLNADFRKMSEGVPSVLALSRDNKSAEASIFWKDNLKPIFDSATDALNGEMTLNRKNGDDDANESQHTYRNTVWFLAVALVLCSLGGAITAFIVVRSLNKALRRAVTELTEGAEQVASAAGQISSSSQSLAQGATEQAASLEETSASSEQISSMAHKSSEISRVAAGMVTDSQHKFERTNQSLEQTVDAMEEISTQSGKISKIIKVIDEIAFQTNILALNAAVEAARAGQAGMGFAVVADEVRNLAQRCAQAARDTASMIEESIAKSNDGKVKVDLVAEDIRLITSEFGKLKAMVDQVNQGSQEQTLGIEQVAKAVVQMQQVTHTTAAGAEEGASAAEELTAQSETMKAIVYQLAEMVGSV